MLGNRFSIWWAVLLLFTIIGVGVSHSISQTNNFQADCHKAGGEVYKRSTWICLRGDGTIIPIKRRS